MPDNRANSRTLRSAVIAGTIAAVIWLAITIATSGRPLVDILGAVIVAIIAAAIAIGFSIYFDTRRPHVE